MKIHNTILEFLLFLVFILKRNDAIGLNNSGVLERGKRGVLFPFGGTFKLVIGLGTPIKLSKTRSITVGWNFQWQYPLPVNTSVIETYPPIISRKTRDDFDVRRGELYRAIESFLSSHSMNLKDCLVRYICEEAYSSFKRSLNGPYGDLLSTVLSPDYEDEIELMYMDARKAGSFGVDCTKLYPNCEEETLLKNLFSLDFT